MSERLVSKGTVIDHCNNCPYYGWFVNHGRCGGAGRDIEGENPLIPDWCPLSKPGVPENSIEALNELSKSDVAFTPEDVRKIAWDAVGRLRDAKSLITELLCDQETLAPAIRNEALVEECKKFLGIND